MSLIDYDLPKVFRDLNEKAKVMFEWFCSYAERPAEGLKKLFGISFV